MESYQATYEQYLIDQGVKIMPSMRQAIEKMMNSTQWENPVSAIDYNNIAVLTLIEADRTDDLDLRRLYLETAVSALEQAIDYPLSNVHLAIVHTLLGQTAQSQNLAFNALLQNTGVLQAEVNGLFFIPSALVIEPQLAVIRLVQSQNAAEQALYLSAIVLLQATPIFYNSMGQRFLNLAHKLFLESPHLALKQGIALLMSGQWEGWLDLHRANALSYESSSLSSKIQLAIAIAQNTIQPGSQPITPTVLFDGLQLAIEPSFSSIVTGVLLGADDWFEAEMEFWRSRILPGMTVIDVGANAGVYTFSAAQKVGTTGRVIAIEPFSGCVQLLQETIRLNALSQVQVCHGAASHASGIAKLALSRSSELNEISTAELPEGSYESVETFTLDSLIDRFDLTQIDFLKIDAEGHEIPILQGSDRLLQEFRPIILYENIAGSQDSNLPIAELLQRYQYEIHTYQPYAQAVCKVKNLDEIRGNLNVIAIPRTM